MMLFKNKIALVINIPNFSGLGDSIITVSNLSALITDFANSKNISTIDIHVIFSNHIRGHSQDVENIYKSLKANKVNVYIYNYKTTFDNILLGIKNTYTLLKHLFGRQIYLLNWCFKSKKNNKLLLLTLQLLRLTNCKKYKVKTWQSNFNNSIFNAFNTNKLSIKTLPNLDFIEKDINFTKKPTVGICVTANYHNKTTHPKLIAKLVYEIKKVYGNQYDVLLMGFGYDQQPYDALQNYLKDYGLKPGHDFIDIINKNSLMQDMQICKALSICITNDSGFMWVANCFGTKTISILGVYHSDLYKPLLNKDTFIPINTSLPCPRSHSNGTECDQSCTKLKHLGVEFYNCYTEDRTPQIMQAIKTLLEQNKANSPT